MVIADELLVMQQFVRAFVTARFSQLSVFYGTLLFCHGFMYDELF